MLLPQSGATAATTVLPSAAAGAVDSEVVVDEPAKKKRSPWTWPLIVLIAILAIVLIGTIIALAMNNDDGGKDPASTSARPTTSSTPTKAPTSAPPPTSEAPQTIQIDRNSYIGMNVDDAAAQIEGLGLPVVREAGGAATEPGLANTVSEVNPSGPVQPGTTITLTYLTDPVAPSAPTAPPTTTANSPVKPNVGQITVNWTTQSCPAGQTLSGYEVSVTGDATVPNNPVFGPGTTSAQINVNNAPGGSFDVTYRYFCGQLDSPFSPALTVDIE
jgi:serine/threonine-protein kinase